MRRGYGERPFVVGEHGTRGEIGFVDGQPVAQDVDVALTQCSVGVEGLDLLETDLAGGITGTECRREPAERRSLGGEDEPDAQQPADVTGQMAGLGQRPFQSRQRGREPSAELFARGSKADPAARPVEELDSETGLEDAHGFAHTRLGDAHALSRTTEVQFVGEHQEDPQLAQFNVSPHRSGILIDPISDVLLIDRF